MAKEELRAPPWLEPNVPEIASDPRQEIRGRRLERTGRIDWTGPRLYPNAIVGRQRPSHEQRLPLRPVAHVQVRRLFFSPSME